MIGGYIIKPDAFNSRELIRNILIEEGICIILYRNILIKKAHIPDLYPKLEGVMLDFAIRHLTSGLSEIGLVSSENIFEKLMKIGGTNTDPMKCERNTIRFMFSNHDKYIYDTKIYFINAFHRTKNEEQTRRINELIEKE